MFNIFYFTNVSLGPIYGIFVIILLCKYAKSLHVYLMDNLHGMEKSIISINGGKLIALYLSILQLVVTVKH